MQVDGADGDKRTMPPDPMNTRLGRWGAWAGTHPGRVLLITLGITVLMTIGAAMLRMEMTFFSIMPQSSRKLQDIQRITEEFPFASTLVAVVDGRELPEATATVTVKATIDAMVDEFSAPAYAAAVSGVYGTVDRTFLERHVFLLAEPKDLSRLETMYADPDLVPFLSALNDDLEREYSGDSEALEDDETQLTAWVDGVEAILQGVADALEGTVPGEAAIDQALDEYLIGETYYLSRDERMGLLFINPTYTMNDLGPLVAETNRIEARSKEIGDAHGTQVGLTGITVVARDEMVTSQQGFGISMTIAVVLILVLMIVVYRIRSTPLIIGIPLLLGIYWTMGATGFIVRRLNIMTAMYMVALVGLGVDYAIHLMTGFVQERDRGSDVPQSLAVAFMRSGRGIVTGGATTAAAFLSLLVAESELLRELAVVAGVGILCELAAMMLLIPALLGLRHAWLQRRGKPDPMLHHTVRIRSDFVAGLGRTVSARPVPFVVGLLVIGVALTSQGPKVAIQDNLMEMEAEGLESVELQDTMIEEFGMAPDVLFVLSDGLSDLPQLVDDIDDLQSVKAVDAITQWLPTAAQQEERRPYLQRLQRDVAAWEPTGTPDRQRLLDELFRLEANLVEMGDLAVLSGTDRVAFSLNRVTGLDVDGNKVRESVFDRLFARLDTPAPASTGLEMYRDRFSSRLAERVYTMAGTEPVTYDDLPPMIRETFYSRDRQSTLITISPRQNPWEGRYRTVFTSQVESVTDRATGMVLASDQLIRIATRDGVRAMVAALIAVFFILMVDFRNVKLVVMTYVPLLLSIGSLYGVMALFGIEFDFVNIIAIPLLVGIGIDNSVHINHHYIFEGPGGMARAMARTGSAVALTTITTMIGFASFIPSIMRAMRSTGVVLTVAMALAFTFAILLHPAALIVAVEKWGWTISPRFLTKEVE